MRTELQAKTLTAIEIIDDSMSIQDKSNNEEVSFDIGDVAIVNYAKKEKPGNYVLVVNKATKSLFVRKLIKKDKDYELIALNPNYPMLKKSRNITIRGVVIARQIDLTSESANT